MQLPDLSSLPPWALFIFAVSVAIIVSVVWLGQWRGSRAPAGTRPVELAMATVDGTALKQVAAAIEALNVTLVENRRDHRESARVTEQHIKAIIRELGELREELRKQGEASRK